ncbi:MAG: type II toxin-antitoxin system PemK/MazF family toxin, partial [Blastocatellia bacterium]|nr:type II toxin-antitoxin system PemK/MazF family toxin [Blastocatellia bacterium]
MNVPRWSVWLADLDPVVGSEQGKTRPVLIIREDQINAILPVVNVLPLTSRKANRKIYCARDEMTILNGDTIGFRPLEFQFLPKRLARC